MGRHEHRYFNGQRWTGDVADGGQRSIDVLPSYLPVAVVPAEVAEPRNGQATAALILGIIATVAGVTVILFFVAGLLGGLAVVFGIGGMRRARHLPGLEGRSRSRGAIALGLVGLALSVVGYLLITSVVPDWLDRLSPDRQAAAHTLSDTSCTAIEGAATYRANLSNDSSSSAGFEVEVAFIDPDDSREVGYDWTAVAALDAGESVSVVVEVPTGAIQDVICQVTVSSR